MARFDLAGQKFGRLLVLSPTISRYGKRHWICECSCGNKTIVSTGGLRFKHTQSCGCLYKDSRGKAQTKHGKAYTPEYRVWKGMIGRCENPSRDYYDRYGGRGIKVCSRWRASFVNFIVDMGQRPSEIHTIERKDNDGDYEPSNCCWATPKEQAANTSRSKRLATCT